MTMNPEHYANAYPGNNPGRGMEGWGRALSGYHMLNTMLNAIASRLSSLDKVNLILNAHTKALNALVTEVRRVADAFEYYNKNRF